MLPGDSLSIAFGTKPLSESPVLLYAYSLSYFSKLGNSHICLLHLGLFNVIDAIYVHCIIAITLKNGSVQKPGN